MTKTRPSISTARQYLRGFLQADRRNMKRMEQVVPETNEQALQHLISNSPWDTEAVMRQVAQGADALLGGHDDTLLVIDESGIPKRGKHSAGVVRQYCGQLGKVENCQVGVYGALARGEKVTLTDARLFVPFMVNVHCDHLVWFESRLKEDHAGVWMNGWPSSQPTPGRR